MIDTTWLAQRFQPDACGDLDAVIAFGIRQDDAVHTLCRFGIHMGQFTDELKRDVELILTLPDVDSWIALLNGERSLMDSFMAGELRSNGYLLWVFRTLAAFTSPADQ